jgi:SagB-type dehydrogenase family enzyme
MQTPVAFERKGERTEPVGLFELGQILFSSAGTVSGYSKRVAPCAGNLKSVDLFVVVRDLDGLQPGLYFYKSEEHRLVSVRLHHHTDGMEREIRAITGVKGSRLPEVVLVFTSTLTRLFHKYGALSYKLAQLDAGSALMQAQACLRQKGFRAGIKTTWNDGALSKLLSLNYPQELPTAVLEIGGEGEAEDATSAFPHSLEEEDQGLAAFGNVSLGGILQSLIRKSEFKPSHHEGLLVALNCRKPHDFRYHVEQKSILSPYEEGVCSRSPKKSVRLFMHSPLPLDIMNTLLRTFMQSGCFRESEGFSGSPL